MKFKILAVTAVTLLVAGTQADAQIVSGVLTVTGAEMH